MINGIRVIVDVHNEAGTFCVSSLAFDTGDLINQPGQHKGAVITSKPNRIRQIRVINY